MIYLFCLLTAIVIVRAMWVAYRQTRDALHPTVYLGPMFIYAYSYHLAYLQADGWMQLLFDDFQAIHVATVFLVAIFAFFWGLLWNRTPADSKGLHRFDDPFVGLLPRRAQFLAAVLASIALVGFSYSVASAGGFTTAYSEAKGGGLTETGYLLELPLLSLPALGLFGMIWAKRGLSLIRVLTLVAIASPLLIHGILGARRGPTFMVVMALVLSLQVISTRQAKPWLILAAVGITGSLTVFLVQNRERIYLGSDWLLSPQQVSLVYRNSAGTGTGDDWAYSAGVILASDAHDVHYWGYRYLAHLLVQPIPRQFWPNKYSDVGLGWMTDRSAMEGMTDSEWASAVGWIPARGAAAGIIADFFLEFSYGGIMACFALGWFYSWLWRKATAQGGVYRPLYLYAVILSIYVPTQNFNAWYYRFLIMSVPTVVIWRFLYDSSALLRRGVILPGLSRSMDAIPKGRPIGV